MFNSQSTEGNEKAPDVKQARPPSISLPKGGGAIRGIGEKFAANPITGTGSMTVPIATSPGRSGFGPQLALSYDSGTGNGPFGFGWNLSLPNITRKTDKGLPQYDDAGDSDVFLLSGAEDLVPEFKKDADGNWVIKDGKHVIFDEPITIGDVAYRVRRYHPCVEGLFARIERWTKVSDPTNASCPGHIHWRSISKDNILTIYGKDENSRIYDPEDSQRIFTWLICETRDDKGNAILYEYKQEDGAGADLAKVHEHNRGDRNDLRRSTNRYLKHIRYGNRKPLLDNEGHRPRFLTEEQIQKANWMFEVVFDYGEHDANTPKPNDAGQWAFRADPFSTYRAGFEVRTTRLCRRVLMFHHFPYENGVGKDCLVRSTDFTYSHEAEPDHTRNPVYTYLLAVTQSGYKRYNGGYLKRSLPPVEFEYSRPIVQDTIQDMDAESMENLPVGLDGASYQWIDLHGEGIPGILTEQSGTWFYKRNLSPVNLTPGNGLAHTEAKFAPVEQVAVKPNLPLANGAQFMDLAGDGRPDLVVLEDPTPGLYEHNGAKGWQPFRPFIFRLSRSTRDPNLRFVDLDGDGHADVLITEDDAFVWHASMAEEGFGPARRVAQTLDEEKGPRLVFAGSSQSIYLADMSGDGLTDLVRIRNGEVCYWPNLGYGRFGSKVTMDHAPHFDNPDQFDQRRIRLADIDGSGTTDIIYLHRDGVRLYFNQSGNSLSEPQVLRVFPRVDDLVAINVFDLLGSGTACLVWSSPLPGDTGLQMRFVDLMGGQKPHLLVKTVNNLGAETRVRYLPSTYFYLKDKQEGKLWITRLPFPVHVVERVETYDHISRNRFVTRYAYHHGYFDGEEREFRGFGMVEQWDTEGMAALASDGMLSAATNSDTATHVPPVHTKTWFHTGCYLDREHVSRQFEDEYYREPGLDDQEFRSLLLPDTVLPTGLTLEEEREACRALKGMMLRQEVYADDAPPGSSVTMLQRAGTPYTVVEQNFSIRALQPRAGQRHGGFFTHTRETITYHYERTLMPVLNGQIVDEAAAAANPGVEWIPDPRVQHTLNLEIDEYGNVLKEAAIAYGRRFYMPDQAFLSQDHDNQRLIHIIYTKNLVTNAIDDFKVYPGDYRTPLAAETCTYELRKPEQEKSSNELTNLYRLDDMLSYCNQASDGQHDVAHEDIYFARAKQAAAEDVNEEEKYFRRLIEHVRTLYRPDNLGMPQNNPLKLLPLGELEPLALPGETYKLAFTPGLLAQVFQRNGQPMLPNPADVLGGQGADQGGYLSNQQLKYEGSFPGSDPDDCWWILAGRVFLSPDRDDNAAQELDFARRHFFLPRRYRDPFGQTTTVTYDDYDLLMVESRDPLNNCVTVGERLLDGTPDPAKPGNDYRVLQPTRIMDPNRNRTRVAFDALGMVVGTAVMGKPEENPGDSLDGFEADLPDAVLDHLANPFTNPHAILGRATSRLVYDLFVYRRTKDRPEPQPAVVYTLVRETHNADLEAGEHTRIQHSFSYSDGFGREIQKKIQAEPGPVPKRDTDDKIIVGADGRPLMTEGDTSPRWVGSGWTIFNNKGKPVRRYEPFFSATHRFEFGVQVGVSPILFYDPIERVVATLHPNNTYEKVLFDPWQQTTYDVNDTVAEYGNETGDPRTDPHIGGYVAGYFESLPVVPGRPRKTWYQQRHTGDLGPHEQNAANKAAAHAGTPTTAYFDTLGRPFLTVAHNKVVCPNHELDGTEDMFSTRVELDIEGNQRIVRDAINQNGDARGRIVMRYDYDMLGNRIHQASMEAGERWMLNDVAGKPIRAWDSRGHIFRTEYDQLRRPLCSFVTGADPNYPDQELLTERLVYGEQHPKAEMRNLRGQLYLHLDQAGAVTTEACDFKGNPLRATRRIAKEYKQAINWNTVDTALPANITDLLDQSALEAALAPLLEADVYTSSTTYDALNRPVTLTTPHTPAMQPSVIRPGYNEANLLERVDVNLRGATANDQPVWTHFVTNIDYDARGQRKCIDYGNGASTSYEYDPFTFRLAHLLTRRNAVAFPDDCPQPPVAGWPGCQVQNLHYTYDPVGNITYIRDDAQQTIYFRNKRVEPGAGYTYDALYRLIEATGREHLGQTGGAANPPTPHSHNDAPRAGLLGTGISGRFSPYDGGAMGRYIERYVYDAVGNFLTMWHYGSDPVHPGWSRTYTYGEASLLEPGKQSNRLSYTMVGSGNTGTERLVHDAHGNIIRMPHMGGAHPAPNMHWDYRDQLRRVDLSGGGTAYYTYDAAGQRVRKVWEKSANLVEERIYLGGFEIYRRRRGSDLLERETLHIMDDKQRIAQVETRTVDTAGNDPAPQQLIRYQFDNHLGSTGLELDDQAQIISYEEYSPYGSTTYQAVHSQTETPKRYRYTSKERDEESGFYYHGARYYAPWLGRWVSCDSELVDGPNLFVYARTSPTNLVDTNGRQSKPPKVKINDVVPYDQRLTDRSSIGVNPQKDHVICQGKQRLINPDIDTSKQLTVVQETGAAKGNAPAKPHTQVTFHDPQADVKEINRLRDLKPEDWTSFEQEIVSPSLESRSRAGYSQSSTNIAALDEIGSMFEVDQPNRAPNSSGPKLDWSKRTEPKGPPVDLNTGNVIKTEGNAPGVSDGKTALKKTGTETLEKGGKTALKKIGKKALKVVPFVGIGAGLYSAKAEAAQGNYGTAALEVVGLVPVAGDVVDAGRLGVAIGEAGSELLGIDTVAAEHGERFENAAKSIGLGDDASTIIGATGAALSSITVAPSIALKRKVMGWFD
ncbi:SpvB/TcaC N-terminal domain-containing protein [Desulfoscipio gibsoniae]|uniref:RHS repeat-associated core domain protein n=1 Tax=Desulfoscipio gibsoniae DSM 7213 TaxID=767817 RepID=R4KIU7_9FIRM|nr:SpvB/TcaC N-terminal domain-containing protein [Desulfoscipio gibsoniae]AGL03143.1 RHS repeat-associated core domain protein [Desulfoscipio gibsoniae DSM 7213]